MTYVLAWLKAFALTLLVELIVATWLLRPAEPSPGRRVTGVTLAQVLSHPAVWFIFPQLPVSWTTIVLLAESWAVLSETLFYTFVFRDLGPRRAFGVAALANGASYGLGLVLQALHWL